MEWKTGTTIVGRTPFSVGFAFVVQVSGTVSHHGSVRQSPHHLSHGRVHEDFVFILGVYLFILSRRPDGGGGRGGCAAAAAAAATYFCFSFGLGVYCKDGEESGCTPAAAVTRGVLCWLYGRRLLAVKETGGAWVVCPLLLTPVVAACGANSSSGNSAHSWCILFI